MEYFTRRNKFSEYSNIPHTHASTTIFYTFVSMEISTIAKAIIYIKNNERSIFSEEYTYIHIHDFVHT